MFPSLSSGINKLNLKKKEAGNEEKQDTQGQTEKQEK